MERSALPAVPLLTGSNYLVWAMKMEAILSLKKLDKMINEEKPAENAEQKTRIEWETKNKETVAYIRLHLSDEQALQFATENEAKLLWIKIKNAYAGAAEDQKIDASNDLKFLRMEEKETVSNYIARARGLATKCASLGLNVTPRELVYYTVRGINNQHKDIREILKTQREKSLEEIHEILKEREKEYQRRGSHIRETDGAYAVQRKNDKRCYNCGRSGHIAKLCWNRKNYKEDHHRATNNYKRDGRKDNDTNRGITERKKSANSIVKPVNGW
ncbi:uncharacterized protein LOC116853021 [Odontomachus brunneus]|uniref:uncharacterized protein LOC116853021 n=1 Tax=Odontomachus brunneus TaxID=486640 RepID=UPI0013F2967B|nr:uncharacterized protein LOC116853021 [Odontomachus brunneus]